MQCGVNGPKFKKIVKKDTVTLLMQGKVTLSMDMASPTPLLTLPHLQLSLDLGTFTGEQGRSKELQGRAGKVSIRGCPYQRPCHFVLHGQSDCISLNTLKLLSRSYANFCFAPCSFVTHSQNSLNIIEKNTKELQLQKM